MKKYVFAALLALGLIAFALPAAAQEKGAKDGKAAEKEAEKEAEADEGMGAIFKGTKEITGKVKVTEESVKRYLKLNESWDEAMAEDEKWDELKQESIKNAYEHALKSKAAQAWAKKNEVDLDDWLRSSLRIMTSAILLFQVDEIKNQKKELEGILKEYQGMPEAERDEDYDFIVLFLEDALKTTTDVLNGIVKYIPEPSAEEKKVLEANKDAILAILNAADGGG